ncbi:Type IV fimbrial biogenesis protein PilY1 [Labilithrix luteola]|uniref:Type IV fimbrial biogenesis protein PilY1 n=1 Tax=Labilithrix luteola TaxID=1391654 RepID=A0A0K1Q301_9BACT|nr:hypothetical protein [Labilithrix luteola]AKV00196.1 Type IV fimbrial biogenesis protein PilY1 [Labilithrix luteola]
MKRRWKTGALALATGPLLAIPIAAFASCATNSDERETSSEDASILLPDGNPAADAEVDVDAGPADAGCEPTDPGCTTEVVDCSTVDWCLVPTTVSPLNALLAIWGTSNDDVWAVGSGGTIIHYDGTVWAPVPSGVQNTFFDIWGSGPNDIWVVSSTRLVLHGTGLQNGAAAWENVPTSLPEASETAVRAVWGSSASDVRIGSRGFTFQAAGKSYTGNQFLRTEYEDGGIGWRPIQGTETVTRYWASSPADVWMTADNSTYAPQERGKTLHGMPSDAGADASPIADSLSWAPVDSQTNVTLLSIWGSSASDVWAVGGLGTIRHITPADERWQQVESKTIQPLRSVWGSGPNDIWVVGDGGTILHYDGTAFAPATVQLPLGRKPNLRAVWGSGPNDVWVVGDGVVLHYTGPKPGKQAGSQ